MNRNLRKAWIRSIRSLREECPCLIDVRIRLVHKTSNHFGLTNLSKNGSRFNITIFSYIREKDGTKRQVTRQELLESLAHEWAHALSWQSGEDEHTNHGPAWGLAYSRCYQATVED